VAPEQERFAVRQIGRRDSRAEGVAEARVFVPVANVSGRHPVGTAEQIKKSAEPALDVVHRCAAFSAFAQRDRFGAVALANAGHTCSCTACDGGVAGTLALKKQHDALVRNELGKALMSLPEDQRLPFMHDQLEAAARRVRAYERDDFGPKNSQYLERWLAVVEAAMSWPATVEEDDGLLDDLLKEIDEEA